MKIDSNDLDMNNIVAWPAMLRYGLVVLIFFILLMLGYLFDIKPQLGYLEYIEQEELTLRQDFEGKQQLAVQLPDYKAQLIKLRQQVVLTTTLFPERIALKILLNDISELGISSGLTFKLIKPIPEVAYDFYVECPIEIQVIGTYQSLSDFINGLLKLPQVVIVGDFQINPLRNFDKKYTDNNVLQMYMTVKTFRYTGDVFE